MPYSHQTLFYLIVFLPLFSFIFLFFFGNKLPRKGDWLATILIGISAVASLVWIILSSSTKDALEFSIPWFNIYANGHIVDFTIDILVGPFARLMLFIVTFISFLVHMYSLEYMKGKLNYTRYFPYLGLFTFSMIGIVVSDNLLITFMFWELVGFSSYLLIGFWFEKKSAVKAAKKAFLFNRIGDIGFLIGLLSTFVIFKTFHLSTIQNVIAQGHLIDNSSFYTILGIGIFLGCVGKSAQFPLQAWLPDAMEGPTPVSALIHAATMVAAGVYLLFKTYFLLNPITLVVIACVGGVTAFLGAIPALAQSDIKKVLAFSTISQLGYMVMGMGVNAPEAALFHLVTHAFFKACLFLSAGAIIHAMHHIKHDLFIEGVYLNFDSQNMHLMGGFRKKMPVTFLCFLIGGLSLAGLPLFSGFLSKDLLLESAFNWAAFKSNEQNNPLFYLVPILSLTSVVITGFYITRQLILVFGNGFNLGKTHPEVNHAFSKVHDPSILMKFPLIILALLSLGFVFNLNPFNAHHSWVLNLIPNPQLSFPEEFHFSSFFISVVSIIAVLTGILLSLSIYYAVKSNILKKAKQNWLKENSELYQLTKNNWYFDTLYYYLFVIGGSKMASLVAAFDRNVIDKLVNAFGVLNVIIAQLVAWVDKNIVDGVVNFSAYFFAKSGKGTKALQMGKIQNYFLILIISISILALIIFI